MKDKIDELIKQYSAQDDLSYEESNCCGCQFCEDLCENLGTCTMCCPCTWCGAGCMAGCENCERSCDNCEREQIDCMICYLECCE